MNNNRFERFPVISIELLRDPDYQGLTLPARQLYIILKIHAYSKENVELMREKGYLRENRNYFAFPPKHQILYGYHSKSNVRRYMIELAQAGYIKKYEGYKGKLAIYKFLRK